MIDKDEYVDKLIDEYQKACYDKLIRFAEDLKDDAPTAAVCEEELSPDAAAAFLTEHLANKRFSCGQQFLDLSEFLFDDSSDSERYVLHITSDYRLEKNGEPVFTRSEIIKDSEHDANYVSFTKDFIRLSFRLTDECITAEKAGFADGSTLVIAFDKGYELSICPAESGESWTVFKYADRGGADDEIIVCEGRKLTIRKFCSEE